MHVTAPDQPVDLNSADGGGRRARVWAGHVLAWAGLVGLWFGGAAMAGHFALQSGWILGSVQGLLPAGLEVAGLRACGLGVCAIGVAGEVDGVLIAGGSGAIAVGVFPPGVRAVALRAETVGVRLGRVAPPPSAPPAPPPDLSAFARALEGLGRVRVEVGRLWIDAGPDGPGRGGLALEGLAFVAAPSGSVALAARGWDLRGPEGEAVGGGGLGVRATLGAEGLSGGLTVSAPRVEATVDFDVRSGVEGLTLELGGAFAVRGGSDHPWRVGVDGVAVRPLALGSPPGGVSVAWRGLHVAMPAGDGAGLLVDAGPGAISVKLGGLLPQVSLTVTELTGGPIGFADVGCGRGRLGRLVVEVDKRLSGALEGLALEDCALGAGPRQTLTADLLLDGGLVRVGLAGIVATPEGVLGGEVVVRRNPLGGRVGVSAEGNALLSDGPLRAALLAGLADQLASTGAEGAATPVDLLAGPLALTRLEVGWEREDGATALVRDAVEVDLDGGVRAAWDGLAWRVEGPP